MHLGGQGRSVGVVVVIALSHCSPQLPGYSIRLSIVLPRLNSRVRIRSQPPIAEGPVTCTLLELEVA